MDQFNPLSSGTQGLHLYDVSVSSAFYSSAYGVAFRASSQDTSAHPLFLTGSADVGYVKNGEKSGFTVLYAPSYSHGFFLPDYHTFNQYLAISATRRIGNKWSLDLTASGILADYNELFFGPAEYGSLSNGSSPTSTTSPVTPIEPSTPIVTSPDTAYLYGARELSMAVDTTLSYEYSPRSTFTADLEGMRTQYLKLEGQPEGYVIPRTTSVHAGLNWNYSLSPRTEITVNVGTVRLFTKYEDIYTSHQRTWLRRTLSPRWYLEGMGGFAVITPVRETYKASTAPAPEYAGGVGYELTENTFYALYERAVSDIYGLGASATDTATVTWRWKRPGGTIALNGVFGFSHFVGTDAVNGSSLTGRFGITKNLNAHTTFGLGYAYAHFPTTIGKLGFSSTRNGIIADISWSPSPRY